MAESTIGLLRVVLSSNAAQFSSEMGKASASVDGFDTSAKKVGTSLTGIATGAKTAEQSTGLLSGTVGKLAASFTAALVVDSVLAGVINFGREALESASKITDLASKTGLTTKSIQEMEHAAVQTGTSLDAFTNAAFQLGVRLSGGSNSVKGAVEALGISYRDLIKLSPDEQFRLIAERLGEVENAQERNKIAVELFGRQAKEILPAIAQGYKDIADSAVIAGDQQLQALDMAGDALDGFANSAKNLSIELAGGLVIAVREVWRTFKEGQDQALAPFAAAWNHATDAMVAWGFKAQEINKVHGPAAAGLKDTTVAAKALTMSWEEMNSISDKLTLSVGKKTAATRTYTSALREAAPAVQAVYGPSEKLLFLESRSIQETAKLNTELQKWAQVNGAVLAPSIRQVSATLEDQIPLINQMTHQWAQFVPGVRQVTPAMASAGDETGNFFTRLFGGSEQLSSRVTQLFSQAFAGGGGALGAIKAFATEGMAALLGMIPGVGPWVSAFAGPIVAMLSKLTKKFTDFFRNIFGGPSAQEVEQRGQVAEFEESLHSALTAGQEAESQGEDWRRTVIAIRDAYIAAGRSEEEALRDAERLWESSRDGGEDALAVIEEIRRKMQALTDGTHEIEIEVKYTGTAPPGASMPGDPESHTQPVDPGFASGTMGRGGNWFKDFGRSFPTRLHGVEAVLRPQDALPFAQSVLGNMSPLEGSNTNNVNVLPVIMGSQMSPREIGRAAVGYLKSSGLPNDESGITSAIESVIDNWMRTYRYA